MPAVSDALLLAASLPLKDYSLRPPLTMLESFLAACLEQARLRGRRGKSMNLSAG
jgi:hypothetical protein